MTMRRTVQLMSVGSCVDASIRDGPLSVVTNQRLAICTRHVLVTRTLAGGGTGGAVSNGKAKKAESWSNRGTDEYVSTSMSVGLSLTVAGIPP